MNLKKLKDRYDDLQKFIDKSMKQRKKLKDKLDAGKDVSAMIQSISETLQRETYGRISGIVTSCLNAVFDDPYEFEIVVQKKRNKTEAKLVYRRDGEEFDPMTESGGGVLDVAAFGLRLATMRPGINGVEPVLLLDEPFKHLSEEYIPRVNELLQTMSKEFKFQFIVITHNQGLSGTKTVHI